MPTVCPNPEKLGGFVSSSALCGGGGGLLSSGPGPLGHVQFWPADHEQEEQRVTLGQAFVKRCCSHSSSHPGGCTSLSGLQRLGHGAWPVVTQSPDENSQREHSFLVRWTWIQALTLPLISCVA